MTSSHSPDATSSSSRRRATARWSFRVGLLALAFGQVAGVTATKSTVHFAQAEQALAQARMVEAETWAPYMWTRANETMKKSREEWAYADFGTAEQLALEAIELAERATRRAQENKAKGVLPGQMRELPKAVEPAPVVEPPAEGDKIIDFDKPIIPEVQPGAVKPDDAAPKDTEPTPWGG